MRIAALFFMSLWLFNATAQDKEKIIQEIRSYVNNYLAFAKKINDKIIVLNLPAFVDGLDKKGFVSSGQARAYYLDQNDFVSLTKLDNLEQDALLRCEDRQTRVTCSIYYIAPFEGRDIITAVALQERAKTKIRIFKQQLGSESLDLKASSAFLPSFLSVISQNIFKRLITNLRSANASMPNYDLKITSNVELLEKNLNEIKISPLVIKWLYILSINQIRTRSSYFDHFLSNYENEVKNDRQATLGDYQARLNVIKLPFETAFRNLIQKFLSRKVDALVLSNCEHINDFKNSLEQNESLEQLFKSIIEKHCIQ